MSLVLSTNGAGSAALGAALRHAACAQQCREWQGDRDTVFILYYVILRWALDLGRCAVTPKAREKLAKNPLFAVALARSAAFDA